jgi:iron(III) transport system permease protein
MTPRVGGAPRAGVVTVVTLVAMSLAALVALPLLVMAGTVWREGAGRALLAPPGLASALRNTFVLAFVVTALAVPLGALLALALRRPLLPGRRLWQLAVLLPILVPDFVLGYSWLRAYGRSGFTDDLLGVHWAGVQGPAGVTVAVAVNAVPFAYLVTAVGLATRAEPSVERAARAAGAGPLTVLRTITLPLLGPALGTAAVLVFVLTLGTFALPQVMGAPAGFATVTTRIYADLTRSSAPAAFIEALTLALLLVLVAALLVAPTDAVLAPRLRARRVASADPVGGKPPRAGDRAAATVIGVGLLLAVCWPLLALAVTSVTKAPGLPPVPDSWTLDHFRAALNARTGAAFARSLWLAGAAASVLVVLGAAVAALERRASGRLTGTFTTLALVLPGSTLAVGLLITYGRWLAGTLTIIWLAYLAKLWAFAHRPISGALDRLPPDELRAARVSGAGPATAMRTVVLRPLTPALVTAWLVCFLTALHEVTMSSLLYGPGSETVAVVVLNSQELGQVGHTAALSVSLTVAVFLPVVVCLPLIRRLGGTASPPTRALPEVSHAG